METSRLNNLLKHLSPKASQKPENPASSHCGSMNCLECILEGLLQLVLVVALLVQIVGGLVLVLIFWNWLLQVALGGSQGGFFKL